MKWTAILFVTGFMYCTQVEKVFFHPGGKNKEPSIDIGQLVFYFPKRQMVNQLSEKELPSGKKEHVYFMPQAEIDKSLLDKVASIALDGLQVRVQEVTAPTRGVQLRLVFDPQKVQIAQHEFDTIGLKKGIMFSFYNKHVLDKLKNRQDLLLQTTCDVSFDEIDTVLIDCGHGGSDAGAKSAAGLKEKDVSLSVGNKVAHELKKKG